MSSTTVSGTAVSPAQEMAALVSAVRTGAARIAELVAAGVLGQVPVSVATEWTEEIVRSADRLTASGATGVGVVDRATALIAGRYVSPRRWIEDSTRVSGGEAAALAGLGRDLVGDYARVGQAWLAGDITRGAVRELTLEVRSALRALPTSRRATERDLALKTLLPFAATEPVSSVHRAVKGLRFVLDPDGACQAAMDAHDDQSLRVAFTGPMAQVSMWTTAQTAAALLTVLDQQVSSWFADGAVPGDEPRDRAVGDGEPARPARYRRDHLLALAFGETMSGLLDRGMSGSRNGVRAHLTLTVDLERYSAGLGGDLHVPGLVDPILLPTATIDRFLCDASLTPVITTTATSTGCGSGPAAEWVQHLRQSARTVLYVGRAHRTAPVRLRRALEVRDQHCAFPDCNVEVSRTHAHHVREWFRDNGPTNLDNLVLLCGRHHHTVHEGRWRITPTPGADPATTGYWTFDPPRPQP
jgi:hypothetical protein